MRQWNRDRGRELGGELRAVLDAFRCKEASCTHDESVLSVQPELARLRRCMAGYSIVHAFVVSLAVWGLDFFFGPQINIPLLARES